ncbi:MAG: YdcH family protein [Halarcobacter ebronensis]|uniref:YdcH family protein n=2 Tax=Campylobacterales TaxID=213849 RepID=UPI003C7441F3
MFHEYREEITELKQKDAHFAKVFEKHNALDEEIQEMEKNHADQFEVEKKKKEKLQLKDEVYNIIVNYKKENNL